MDISNYFDIYFTQLFTTLGQFTAATITATVAVPMATFYWPRVQRMLMNHRED